ncbi:ABC transporter ATP-binding protein [Streptomyces hainanensis]|uniref:ABC transporter ATP-binding protein n=1 Tax=Streptomyces hainanensis TaxID=402648 RepID=A0A4R4TLV2_9ACTN|nr:ABC transporter ATP-binding protein [Streptomyces hainanensis]TDC79028.1 ABC transporter ATP-binding protein [Streptomyces hainanensis]
MSEADRPGSGWIRRLASIVMRHRRDASAILVTAVLGMALEAVGPLLLRLGVNDAVAGETGRIPWLVTAMVALALIQFGAEAARRFVSGRLALSVQHALRAAIFASVQRLDGARQDTLRTGQVISRANSDLQQIQVMLSMIPIPIGAVALFVVALAAMLWLSPFLTIVALTIVPAFVWISVRSRQRLYPATWSARQQAAEVAGHVERTVSGVRVVRGFGQESRETARFTHAASRLYGEWTRAARFHARPIAALTTLPALGQIGVLAVGGWLALRGDIDLGTFLAFAGYLAMLVVPARLLANFLVIAQQARAGAERVFEIVDSQPAVTEAPDAVDVPDGPLAVEFEDVDFGYRRSDPVLNKLSLTLRPGETLALVGGAGSGKSTVSLLLPRFYDVQSGAIRLGPPGRTADIRGYRLESLRTAMDIVFEEAFLFSASIRDNIAYGRPEASDLEILSAAKAAQAHEFISRLPDSYDTVVGERGHTLSGGQRQRIALARALLSTSRLVILDDATSAVDTTTEAAIHESLRTITATRTTLLIAHRRATLELADRIAVLDEGRIIDMGTQAELRRRCPQFVALFTEPAERHPPAGGPEAEARREHPPSLWPDTAAPKDEHAAVEAPALRRAVAALPPADERPGVDEAPLLRPCLDFGLPVLLRPVRRGLLAGLSLVALGTLAAVSLPLLIQHGVDAGVGNGSGPVLIGSVVVALITVILNWFVLGAQVMVTRRSGERMLFDLRVRVYAQLQRLGLNFYERERGGEIMTRVANDIDAMADFLQSGVLIAVVSVVTMLALAITMLAVDPSLALTTFAVLPLVALATIVFWRLSTRWYLEARRRIGKVNASLLENISGLRLSQSAGRASDQIKEFARLSDHYRLSRVRTHLHSAIYYPWLTLCGELAKVAVLAVGATRVAEGSLSPGVLIAFFLFVSQFFSPVQQLSLVLDSYYQARVGLLRTQELLRLPADEADRTAGTVQPPARFRGEIELRKVTHQYPGTSHPAVEDISLRILPGQTVALVGATGAGKSTLVKLLVRLYEPAPGTILVDGVDIRCYSSERYRQRIGYVPQEPYLFEGDVAENIRYGAPEATDARVEAAAREVGALNAVATLPRGFRQEVGEGGRRLSMGQRQLIALARAALVDPGLLILDEATAALDPTSERLVRDARRRLTAKRTTVLVAHRLSTAAEADVIAVLDAGRVVEHGHHDELLQKEGAYARLWSHHSQHAGQDRSDPLAADPHG